MSIASFSKLNDEIVLCENAFTSNELNEIAQICNNTLSTTPVVDVATGDNTTRKVVTSWVSHTKETSFMYKHMSYLAREINSKYFNFDLTGFIENGMLFVSYAMPGDHLDWHTDKVNYDGKRTDIAKLALVLDLSDPSEYKGCAVQFMTDGLSTINQAKGLIYAMPGYVSHSVTPLISGTRNVLVAWITGPNFR